MAVYEIILKADSNGIKERQVIDADFAFNNAGALVFRMGRYAGKTTVVAEYAEGTWSSYRRMSPLAPCEEREQGIRYSAEVAIGDYILKNIKDDKSNIHKALKKGLKRKVKMTDHSKKGKKK